MYHYSFIYPSIDGHLSCFHVLAVVNNGTVNTGVQIMVFSKYMPSCGIAWSYGSAILLLTTIQHCKVIILQ